MVPCDVCGQEFKTTQALAGHRRWKHQGLPAVSARRDGSELAPVDGPGGEAPVTNRRLDDLQEYLQDYLGQMLCDLYDEVKVVTKELAAVKDIVGSQPVSQHAPGLCMVKGCGTCEDQVRVIYAQGREDLDAEHRAIPTVEDALQAHEFLEQLNDQIKAEGRR